MRELTDSLVGVGGAVADVNVRLAGFADSFFIRAKHVAAQLVPVFPVPVGHPTSEDDLGLVLGNRLRSVDVLNVVAVSHQRLAKHVVVRNYLGPGLHPVVRGGDSQRFGQHTVSGTNLDGELSGQGRLQPVNQLHGRDAVDGIPISEHHQFFRTELPVELRGQDAQVALVIQGALFTRVPEVSWLWNDGEWQGLLKWRLGKPSLYQAAPFQPVAHCTL